MMCLFWYPNLQPRDADIDEYKIMADFLPLLREVLPTAAEEIEHDIHDATSKQGMALWSVLFLVLCGVCTFIRGCFPYISTHTHIYIILLKYQIILLNVLYCFCWSCILYCFITICHESELISCSLSCGIRFFIVNNNLLMLMWHLQMIMCMTSILLRRM